MKFLNILNKLKFLYIVEVVLILIGVILRLKLYLYNQSFNIDECGLGINIVNISYLNLFKPLYNFQCAPPLFLIICKCFLDMFHLGGHLFYQDLALRFFPFLCSCVSLPLFAIFLNKITNNKIFVWIALAMMTFNKYTIYYATIFKQYSCELMFSLILLLIFFDFSINISKKKLILYSFVICASIWFSGTALFLLGSGTLYFIYKCFSKSFFNNIKPYLPKLVYILLIPFIINLLVYYFFYLKPVLNAQFVFMQDFWTNIIPSFFTLNNFFVLFPENLQNFIETPFLSKYLIIFLLLNVVILLKRDDFEFKVKFFVIVPITFSIIVSFLKIYPFFSKFILYLLPIFIILYCQSLCFIKYLNMKRLKLFKIMLFLVLAVLFIIKINKPARYQIIWKNPSRECVLFILQNKIPLNKVILVSEELSNYYLNSTFPNQKALLYDWPWDGFKVSPAKNFIDTCAKGDYWFINMFESNDDYTNQYLNYYKNSKHIKILKVYHYEKPENTYIIHFEKISD